MAFSVFGVMLPEDWAVTDCVCLLLTSLSTNNGSSEETSIWESENTLLCVMSVSLDIEQYETVDICFVGRESLTDPLTPCVSVVLASSHVVSVNASEWQPVFFDSCTYLACCFVIETHVSIPKGCSGKLDDVACVVDFSGAVNDRIGASLGIVRKLCEVEELLVPLPSLQMANFVPLFTAVATILDVATGIFAMVALIRFAVDEAEVNEELETMCVESILVLT